MNFYTDIVVAAVAILGACACFAIGVGSWAGPYQLRSVARIVDRFGMPVARGAWLLVALVSLTAGVAIASGIRPSYAHPDWGRVENPR